MQTDHSNKKADILAPEEQKCIISKSVALNDDIDGENQQTESSRQLKDDWQSGEHFTEYKKMLSKQNLRIHFTDEEDKCLIRLVLTNSGRVGQRYFVILTPNFIRLGDDLLWGREHKCWN